MAHHIEERQYLPDGCSPEDPDASSFMVAVVHRGRGKWAVLKSGQRYVQLSSTGKWLVAPARMNELTHCRHDFATACSLAEVAVEALEVHGKTWAQWAVQQNGHFPAPNPEVELAEAASDLG